MWESEELQDDSSGWTQQEDSLFKNRQILTHNESKILREGEWSTHSGLFSTMLIRSPRPFLLINSLAKVESYRKIKFLFNLGCNLYTVRKKSLIKTHHLKCFRSKECIHMYLCRGVGMVGHWEYRLWIGAAQIQLWLLPYIKYVDCQVVDCSP